VTVKLAGALLAFAGLLVVVLAWPLTGAPVAFAGGLGVFALGMILFLTGADE